MSAYPADTLRAKALRALYIGYDTCYRCGVPCAVTPPHETHYLSSHTCFCAAFALCERCWAYLSPERRLPYYRALLDTWPRETVSADGPSILKAVREGR